jgi:hypothetical protein
MPIKIAGNGQNIPFCKYFSQLQWPVLMLEIRWGFSCENSLSSKIYREDRRVKFVEKMNLHKKFWNPPTFCGTGF